MKQKGDKYDRGLAILDPDRTFDVIITLYFIFNCDVGSHVTSPIRLVGTIVIK